MNIERVINLIYNAEKGGEFLHHLGCFPEEYFNRYGCSIDTAMCVLMTFGITIPRDIQEAYEQHLERNA
jgi:hypothetical protein